MKRELCWGFSHSDLDPVSPAQKPRNRGECEQQASVGQEQGKVRMVRRQPSREELPSRFLKMVLSDSLRFLEE